jgi:hypothetical protein
MRSQFVDAPLLVDPIPCFGFRVEGVDNARLGAGLCHFDITSRLDITSRPPLMGNNAVGDRSRASNMGSAARIAISLNAGKISNYRTEGQTATTSGALALQRVPTALWTILETSIAPHASRLGSSNPSGPNTRKPRNADRGPSRTPSGRRGCLWANLAWGKASPAPKPEQ